MKWIGCKKNDRFKRSKDSFSMIFLSSFNLHSDKVLCFNCQETVTFSLTKKIDRLLLSCPSQQGLWKAFGCFRSLLDCRNKSKQCICAESASGGGKQNDSAQCALVSQYECARLAAYHSQYSGWIRFIGFRLQSLYPEFTGEMELEYLSQFQTGHCFRYLEYTSRNALLLADEIAFGDGKTGR